MLTAAENTAVEDPNYLLRHDLSTVIALAGNHDRNLAEYAVGIVNIVSDPSVDFDIAVSKEKQPAFADVDADADYTSVVRHSILSLPFCRSSPQHY